MIFSTPLAESSVTIPNLDIVVDFGRCKRAERDGILATELLSEEWCSRAELTQRAGRVGRTHPGMVFRFFPIGVCTKELNPSDLENHVDQVRKSRGQAAEEWRRQQKT